MTGSTRTPSEVSVRPLRTEEDLDWAFAQIDALVDAVPGTPDYDRLDVISTLVEAYEARHHAIPPPDPVDAILFRMEQQGHTRSHLAHLFGSRSRASEVLSRKRPLSIAMVRVLHREWGIPLESLLAES